MAGRTGTCGLFPLARIGTMLASVEGPSIAHVLPELYRAVLERIASLEHAGHRSEALLIRRAAGAAYARAWDEAALRRLEQMRDRKSTRLNSSHIQKSRMPSSA